MYKRLLATSFLLFFITQAKAQLVLMKMVGNDTKDYKIGFGSFLKTGFAVSEGSDVTLEIAADIFLLDGGDGTLMCPLEVGYRYTLNGTGTGLYIEPQAGFNLYGVTSLTDEDGQEVNLKYHGIVFALGTGYLFSVLRTSFDVNLHYETVVAHGGSNNFVSLGITKFLGFGRRDSPY
jgi:hypothetical protein